jgi:transcriptional repressor NrdR
VPLADRGPRKALDNRKRPDYRAGFACPLCGEDTRVNESHGYREGEPMIRRRRVCPGCKHRFTTLERVPIARDITVVKRNASREPFDRDKLRRSLELAFAKRSISAERLHRIVASVLLQIDGQAIHGYDKPQHVAVTSQKIGALCLASLKELDDVAYIRYMSIFRHFHTKTDYMALITSL